MTQTFHPLTFYVPTSGYAMRQSDGTWKVGFFNAHYGFHFQKEGVSILAESGLRAIETAAVSLPGMQFN